MGADELDAVGDLPFQRLDGAPLHIFVGQQRLALGPALDPLEQSTGEVPARLARRLGGIEVNMGLDKGRDRQSPLSVQHPTGDCMFVMGFDGGDDTILTADLPQPFPIGKTNMLNQHLLASCTRTGRWVRRTRMK